MKRTPSPPKKNKQKNNPTTCGRALFDYKFKYLSVYMHIKNGRTILFGLCRTTVCDVGSAYTNFVLSVCRLQSSVCILTKLFFPLDSEKYISIDIYPGSSTLLPSFIVIIFGKTVLLSDDQLLILPPYLLTSFYCRKNLVFSINVSSGQQASK